jgi:hypothetical protein
MRTLLISYDLAKPHRNKHVLAQEIMSLGARWARPLKTPSYPTHNCVGSVSAAPTSALQKQQMSLRFRWYLTHPLKPSCHWARALALPPDCFVGTVVASSYP